jgi:hypothetical protein
VNKEIRKMASQIVSEFDLKLEIDFYEVDDKVAIMMKQVIEQHSRQNSIKSIDSASIGMPI